MMAFLDQQKVVARHEMSGLPETSSESLWVLAEFPETTRRLLKKGKKRKAGLASGLS